MEQYIKCGACPEDVYRLLRGQGYLIEYYAGLGFGNPKELMQMRVFDLLNMNGIDAIRAEETVIILYHLFNENEVADRAMQDKAMSQSFDFAAWRKAHGNYSEVTVSDIVLAEDINEKAVTHIFNIIKRAFFRSPEYNSREYRYYGRDDYLAALQKAGRT